MSEQGQHSANSPVRDSQIEGGSKTSADQHRPHQPRVDTEHRGVTGTLILTDTLDEKVRCSVIIC